MTRQEHGADIQDHANIVTLEQFIIDRQKSFPHSTGAFSRLLRDISVAAKIVNRDIRRAGLIDIALMAGRVATVDEAVIPLGEGRLVAMIPDTLGIDTGGQQGVALRRQRLRAVGLRNPHVADQHARPVRKACGEDAISR